MPIYEYKCGKCGNEFEVFQGVSDPAVTSCKLCNGRVRKLMSLSSFHLKGSGWYATDYSGKKAPGGEKKKEAPSPEAESEKKSTPSETKPE